MKLLIVDDSRAMRMIISKALKVAGFDGLEIIEAADGPEAIEKINNDSPDLVLSDWNMPEMKGIELLRKLRDSGNEVRFGFITSESGTDTAAEARASGAEFVITKPFSPEKLESVLTPILS